VIFEDVQRTDQVAAVAGEARGQLDQAGAGVGQALQGLYASTRGELTGAGTAAAASMTDTGNRGASDVGTAGATILEKIGSATTSAVTSINARGDRAQATLVGGGQTFAQQLAQGHGQFTSKLGGLVDFATRTISEKVDAGLAYQDQWVERARGEARSASQQIGQRYDTLKAEADAQNSAAQRSWLSDAWGAVTGWIDSVRQAFLRKLGNFWGGLLFGILSAIVIVVIGLAIGWAVGAIVGLFIASSTVAAIVTAVILIGGAIGIAIYARFQEFYADNPGQDAGFWRGLGLVGLGIADLTGIPYMIEGIAGQRAFGAKMNTAQSAERFGMGLVFFITAGIATWRGVKWFRGRAPTAPPVERPPVERPPADPNRAPVDPNRAPADPARAAGEPDQAPAEPNRPGRPAARPEAPRGWRGTLNEFGKRLRWPARSARAPGVPGANEIPVGEVNLDEVRAMGVDEAWARQQAQVYRAIADSEIGRNNPSARPRAEWLEALADRLRAQPRGPGLTVTPQPPPPRDHDDEN
jgi:hypothetical protein